MASQEEILLLNRLRRLLPDQFEGVVFRLLDVLDRSYLRESGSQVNRAMTLIQLLEQQSKLGLLKKDLDALDFKEILPAGAYLVGQELREREEARERQEMEEAEARGEDPEDYRVTPEKFYTFRPEAAWLGVFRGWDAPRSFHSEIVQRVVDASHDRNNCPAAAIIGHGGSGKSVALRRLAVDLAERGCKVWWVEEPEQLLQFGLSQIVDVGSDPQFLLVDDIQYLEDGHAQRFKRDFQKNQSLILVVAGRKLPPAFHVRVRPSAGLFNPYKAIDGFSILDKIAVTIPEWADTAEKLKAEPLWKARLIRILVVLARRKAAPRNLEELETAFLEILADDISKIRSTLPGLADAVIDAAAIREVGHDISRVTFIALAKYHQPEAPIQTLLKEIIGNRRWQVLESLSSYNPEYDTVQFHHDELAEGIILAGQHGLLGSRIIGDDAWREATLDMVINRGSKPSSSYALSDFVRNHPGIISQESTLKYIDQLIAAGNGHHAYLRLIVDEALDLKQQERLELLLAAARVAPLNTWLWSTVRGWIQRNYQKKEERCEVLEQLYQAGCRGSTILIPFLRCLPHKSACIIAKKLLTESNNPFVLCACLRLLGDEAKGEAKRLLVDKTTNPSVLHTCLNILGDDAKDEAKILLKKSKDSEVICACLNLLDDGAKDEAKRLLADKTTHPSVLCACLNRLGYDAKDEAKRLLADKTTHPSVLCACLNLLGYGAKDDAKILMMKSEDPKVLCTCLNLPGYEAKDEAKVLLKKSEDPKVLCACLNLLGNDAKDEAKRLLADKTTNPSVLCTCLNLLGYRAKDDAKILMMKSEDPKVLCACLNLLGDDAKDEAKRLLADKTTNPSVLSACLYLLGYRAKDEAKTLLEKSKDPKVLCACLNLLDDGAKDEAKSLLADKTTHPSVLSACLYLLGYRAKDEAKILLEKSKDPQLICACLNVLGDEAKDEAKSFLGGKTTDPTVLCACLNLLSDEATDEAKRLLTESKNPDVHATCLKLLRVYTIGGNSTCYW